MKKFTLIIGLSGLFNALNAQAIVVGDDFPKIEIKGYEKGAINAESLQGKVTLINFWATWCEACKVELKEMETEFQALFKEKDFSFSFVSLDKEPTKAEAWVKENLGKSEFMQYLFKDPEFSAAQTLSVDAFPMTLIIDKAGKITYIQKGFKTGEGSTEKLAEEVKKLLKT